MGAERELLEIPPNKPPKWWHDAIRDNLPGNQVNQNKFETEEVLMENGVAYTIWSFISDDAETGVPEGIYIDTNISDQYVNEAAIRMFPIVASIRELLLNAARAGNYKNEGGIATKFFPQSGKDTLAFSLHPVSLVELKKLNINMDIDSRLVKEELVNTYFNNFNYVERVKIVSNETLSPEIKKEILKRDIFVGNEIIQVLINRGAISVDDLEKLRYDKETQEVYQNLFKRILSYENIEQAMDLNWELKKMDFLHIAGWFEFCRKYWEDKLGEKLT